MFAVVRTGGKQYRVAEGDKIVVEKMDGNAGDRVTLGDVLLAGEGSELKPTDGLTVAAEIVAQAKADKVTVFKKKRRHNYRRKKGHRQQHTILQIIAIGKESKKQAKPKAESAPAADTKAADSKAAAPAGDAAPAKAESGGAKKPAAKAEKAKGEKKQAAPKAEKKSTKDAAPAKGGAKKSSKEK